MASTSMALILTDGDTASAGTMILAFGKVGSVLFERKLLSTLLASSTPVEARAAAGRLAQLQASLITGQLHHRGADSDAPPPLSMHIPAMTNVEQYVEKICSEVQHGIADGRFSEREVNDVVVVAAEVTRLLFAAAVAQNTAVAKKVTIKWHVKLHGNSAWPSSDSSVTTALLRESTLAVAQEAVFRLGQLTAQLHAKFDAAKQSPASVPTEPVTEEKRVANIGEYVELLCGAVGRALDGRLFSADEMWQGLSAAIRLQKEIIDVANSKSAAPNRSDSVGESSSGSNAGASNARPMPSAASLSNDAAVIVGVDSTVRNPQHTGTTTKRVKFDPEVEIVAMVSAEQAASRRNEATIRQSGSLAVGYGNDGAGTSQPDTSQPVMPVGASFDAEPEAGCSARPEVDVESQSQPTSSKSRRNGHRSESSTASHANQANGGSVASGTVESDSSREIGQFDSQAPVDSQVDPGLWPCLQPFQRQDVRFLCTNIVGKSAHLPLDRSTLNGAILNYQRGLGVELTTIACLHALMHHRNVPIGNALLLVESQPKLDVWLDEFAKWGRRCENCVPPVRCVIVKSKNELGPMMAKVDSGTVFVMTYRVFGTTGDIFQPDLLICADAQTLPSSDRDWAKFRAYQSLERVVTPARIVLCSGATFLSLRHCEKLVRIARSDASRLIGDPTSYAVHYYKPIDRRWATATELLSELGKQLDGVVRSRDWYGVLHGREGPMVTGMPDRCEYYVTCAGDNVSRGHLIGGLLRCAKEAHDTTIVVSDDPDQLDKIAETLDEAGYTRGDDYRMMSGTAKENDELARDFEGPNCKASFLLARSNCVWGRHSARANRVVLLDDCIPGVDENQRFMSTLRLVFHNEQRKPCFVYRVMHSGFNEEAMHNQRFRSRILCEEEAAAGDPIGCTSRRSDGAVARHSKALPVNSLVKPPDIEARRDFMLEQTAGDPHVLRRVVEHVYAEAKDNGGGDPIAELGPFDSLKINRVEDMRN